MQLLTNVKNLFLNKGFYKNLALIILFWVIAIFAIFYWLKSYTNHGQQLTLPDYVGDNIVDARKDALEKSFDIVVNDSIHIVGTEGGKILSQNPSGSMKVKEGRKMYVTISKYNADLVSVARFPILYGKNFDRKSRELKNAFEIESKVLDYKYDPGPPDHILAVIFKGDTIVSDLKRNISAKIPKGSTLGFILSNQAGGELSVPDLTCKTYDEAQFYLDAIGLYVSAEYMNADVVDKSTAYIFKQEPSVNGGTIGRGEGIQIYLTQKRPSNCLVDEEEMIDSTDQN
jgi:beta-lactam-binding protein with PASTA domain